MKSSIRTITMICAAAMLSLCGMQKAQAASLPQTDAEYSFDNISFVIEDAPATTAQYLEFEYTPAARTEYTAPAAEFEYTAPAAQTAPVREDISAELSDRGSFGRLYIDSVDVSVAVFYTTDMTSLQTIVDGEDSACMFDWSDGNMLIADHSHQGFSAIGGCVPGTTAELVTADGTLTYTCKEIIPNGWNTGRCLAYNDFTPIGTNYTASLVMYTCNADGTVTITIWG